MARRRARRETTPPTYTIARTGLVRFDLRDPYHLAVRISWPRFALLFLGLNLAINLIFATLYLLVPGSIANAQPGNFWDALFFSFETMATVGYGVMSPATHYGHIVATIEIMCGMAFTAIMTGLTFVRFARPTAKVLYADKAIITLHDGKPTLMIRLGNARVGLIADASVRLTALLARRSSEGQAFRLSHDLKLRSARLPVFALTWTVMHAIEEDSPLHGISPEWIEQHNPVIFLNFEGRDPALAAQVHDLKQYGAADLTRISHVEPE